MNSRLDAKKMDVSQRNIQLKIQAYLRLQQRSPELTTAFRVEKGHCHGFATVVLYAQYLESIKSKPDQHAAQDNWTWLLSVLLKLSNWNENLDQFTEADKNNIDRLISLITWFQHISRFLPIGQGTLHEYLEDTAGRQLKQEYTFAGLFDANDFTKKIDLHRPNLTTLFSELFRHNRRLILVSCGRHTLSIFKYKHTITLYDANYRTGCKQFNYKHPQVFIASLFKSYKYDENTKSPFGFRIFTFDPAPKSYPLSSNLLNLLGSPTHAESKPPNQIQYHALHIAARIGSLQCVQYYLNQRVDISEKNDQAKSALYLAASRGHKLIATALIESGANIHQLCFNNRTPLKQAAANGHLDIVKMMLESEAIPSLNSLAIALNKLNPSNDPKKLILSIDKSILKQMIRRAKHDDYFPSQVIENNNITVDKLKRLGLFRTKQHLPTLMEADETSTSKIRPTQ